MNGTKYAIGAVIALSLSQGVVFADTQGSAIQDAKKQCAEHCPGGYWNGSSGSITKTTENNGTVNYGWTGGYASCVCPN